MPQGKHLTQADVDQILTYHEEGLSVAAIRFKLNISEPTIRKAIRKYSPDTKLAERLLKASAVELASRVIHKANVAEAIDVLSRPNMDVLKPAAKGPAGGSIFMSITAGSLGGVIEGKTLALPETTEPE